MALYYLCSENKGADQLCSYCMADLRLCFRIGKILFSHDATQNSLKHNMGSLETGKKASHPLIELVKEN